MSKTIIFISGIWVPNFVAKSQFVWNASYWQDYQCLWVPSKIPRSDVMVTRELDRLQRLLDKNPGATVCSQSLGAWWAANLACRQDCYINKLVLWTPLCNTQEYPIFNVTPVYHPINQYPNPHNMGFNRVLVLPATNDLVVPPNQHGFHLIQHFKALQYSLSGGHYFQRNRLAALAFIRSWIELK